MARRPARAAAVATAAALMVGVAGFLAAAPGGPAALAGDKEAKEPKEPAKELLKVGGEVPDAKLRMADGTDVKVSSHEGKVVVLYFYGTWGRKAPAQAKKMDELRKARAKQKLAVVGIARDATREDAKKFGEDHSLGFPQAADPKDDLYSRFAEKGLPWIAVVDARDAGKRTLRYSAGGLDEEVVGNALAELLGKTDAEREKEEREKAEKAKAAKAAEDGAAPEKAEKPSK